MSGSRWWHGLPVYAVPSSVYRAESARLHAAIDLQREAVNAAKWSAALAEPLEAEAGKDAPPAEPAEPAEPIGEEGATGAND